jgi:branched-chain amino acid transport system permease protein
VVFGPVLIALMIFLPDGIVGTWLKRRARARMRSAPPRPPTPALRALRPESHDHRGAAKCLRSTT